MKKKRIILSIIAVVILAAGILLVCRYGISSPLVKGDVSIDKVEYYHAQIQDSIQKEELEEILSRYKKKRSTKYIFKSYVPSSTPRGERAEWNPDKIIRIELQSSHEPWVIVFEYSGEALCYKEASDIWEIIDGDQLLEELKQLFSESGL